MTDKTGAEYEIFALRYAWRDAKRSDHFIGGAPHDAPAGTHPAAQAPVTGSQSWPAGHLDALTQAPASSH